MSIRSALALGLVLAAVQIARAQARNMTLPTTVQAGSAFSIQTAGSGNAVLYIVGPAQALRQNVQLGQTATFPAGYLHNAGRYLAILVGASSTNSGSFDVVAATQPVKLSFLAKPSRLAVDRHNGISGAVYVFDAYGNLITRPISVSFDLSAPSGTAQRSTTITRNGAAWTEMNSTSKEGIDKFSAHVNGVSSTRIIQQVPGDPCGLRMSAQQSGNKLELKTDPVRDCSGNAVPDGTIVTFTETHNGSESTVDEPIKRGIAQAEMPANKGATISVASGVVLGNEIHWEK